MSVSKQDNRRGARFHQSAGYPARIEMGAARPPQGEVFCYRASFANFVSTTRDHRVAPSVMISSLKS